MLHVLKYIIKSVPNRNIHDNSYILLILSLSLSCRGREGKCTIFPLELPYFSSAIQYFLSCFQNINLKVEGFKKTSAKIPLAYL